MVECTNYNKLLLLFLNFGKIMTDAYAQITDLQIKIAYLENTVDALNDVIASQDKTLQDLQDQLRLVYKFLESRDDDGIAPFDLLADRPPHY